MTKINYNNINKYELVILTDVVNRAVIIWTGMDRGKLRQTIMACHCNNYPLDLRALLNYPDDDFINDICGMYLYLNRETFVLEDFVPKCKKEAADV